MLIDVVVFLKFPKRLRQYQKVLWVVIVFVRFDWSSQCFTKLNEEERNFSFFSFESTRISEQLKNATSQFTFSVISGMLARIWRAIFLKISRIAVLLFASNWTILFSPCDSTSVICLCVLSFSFKKVFHAEGCSLSAVTFGTVQVKRRTKRALNKEHFGADPGFLKGGDCYLMVAVSKGHPHPPPPNIAIGKLKL